MVRNLYVFVMQAARVIANLLVAGAGILIRAGTQAYRQAIISKSLFRSPPHADDSHNSSGVVFVLDLPLTLQGA
jgi:hypothetical protein